MDAYQGWVVAMGTLYIVLIAVRTLRNVIGA